MINARAESLMEKPAFKHLVGSRRCIIPADGFYEWRKEGKWKVPMWVYLKSKEPPRAFWVPGVRYRLIVFPARLGNSYNVGMTRRHGFDGLFPSYLPGLPRLLIQAAPVSSRAERMGLS